MNILREVEQTHDFLERALKLAAVVSGQFADERWKLVVVGGSAVECYTGL